MICEMCGTETNNIKRINIEGSLLSVCPNCAKFGVEPEIEPKSESARSRGRTTDSSTVEMRLEQRKKRMQTRNIFANDSEVELIEDYHRVIQSARMELGLNQEELARKLNERKSIIAKLETKSLRPDNKLIRKLEKTLKIILMERIE